MQNLGLQKKRQSMRLAPPKAEAKLRAVKRAVKRSEQAPSDVGFLLLLTLILAAIGRAMGSWVSSDQVQIQRAPGESVSRGEEYRKLHEQVGPNSFFRMF
jgi:hypothetical protein